MIQNIAPWHFHNEFHNVPPSGDDLVLDIDENGILLASDSLRPPRMCEWKKAGGRAALTYAFCLTADDAPKNDVGNDGQKKDTDSAVRSAEKTCDERGRAAVPAESDKGRHAGEPAAAESPFRPEAPSWIAEQKSDAAPHSFDSAMSAFRPFVHMFGEMRCFLALRGAGESFPAPEGWVRIAPSALRGHPAPLPFAAATALHLFRWYNGHRFCGRCGSPVRHSNTERALVCPDCGEVCYPVIAPCVLVAVTCGEKILLTRYARPGASRLVLVAGFVEIGETAEQAATREVMEETGLRIRNLRYVGSQPWGFSGTLATGFAAELDGPDAIRLDTSELAEARWVSRADIPPCPDESSLTMTMISRFARGDL